VVSVGNLTLGGTGKTPLVEWIVRWFTARNVPVAIVSRGYGAGRGEHNDEAKLLERHMPGLVHVQHADRVAAAARAVSEHACRVIVLDDGFQHRRLSRELDMVLLDALEPFGFGRLFPRGTLREPAESLARAGVVALSRCNLVGPAERDVVRRRVEHLAPDAHWCELRHRPRCMVQYSGAEQPIELFRGRRVVGFCGIGNPAGFRRTLRECGCELIAFREYQDHYPFSYRDVQELSQWAEALGAEEALCTEKDLVKLAADRLDQVPLWAVSIEIEFREGQAGFESRLEHLVSHNPRP
jgi:tetraacyldisaccharide 4'-kinase